VGLVVDAIAEIADGETVILDCMTAGAVVEAMAEAAFGSTTTSPPS